MAAATSSGRPIRRTGVRSACSSTPPPRSPFASWAREHRGVDEPGRDRVDGDALGTELEGEGLREPDDAGLRRHVGRHERLAALRTGRGDVDDTTPAGLEHVREHDLAAVVGAHEVDVEHPLPGPGVDLQEGAEDMEPGVVDQDRGSTKTVSHLGDRDLDAGAVGDVGLDADGRSAAGGDLRRRLLRRGGVAVENGHGRAVGGQPLADGQPDARTAAGDHGDLVALAARCHRVAHLLTRSRKPQSDGGSATHRRPGGGRRDSAPRARSTSRPRP